jgi:hypothetical protein
LENHGKDTVGDLRGQGDDEVEGKVDEDEIADDLDPLFHCIDKDEMDIDGFTGHLIVRR